jgi:hypothetical protein
LPPFAQKCLSFLALILFLSLLAVKGFERVKWVESKSSQEKNADGAMHSELRITHVQHQCVFFKVEHKLYDFGSDPIGVGQVVKTKQYNFFFSH